MSPEIEQSLVETIRATYPALFDTVCRLVAAGETPASIRRMAASVPGANRPGGIADHSWTIAHYLCRNNRR